MYGTIGGSLTIWLSNNPVFLGAHFVRVELLEVICLCGFRCYPRVICRVFASFFLSRLIYIVWSSLNVSSGGTKFEIFREHVGYLHFYYYAEPGCLINCCKLYCFLSRVAYLALSGFARDSCNFPCGKLLCYYVSCIDFILRFVLPVLVAFWHWQCYRSHAILWKPMPGNTPPPANWDYILVRQIVSSWLWLVVLPPANGEL